MFHLLESEEVISLSKFIFSDLFSRFFFGCFVVKRRFWKVRDFSSFPAEPDPVPEPEPDPEPERSPEPEIECSSSLSKSPSRNSADDFPFSFSLSGSESNIKK
jgi:hypothetical protein